MKVEFKHCQPFRSRVGIDTVVCLKFDFNIELINALRDIFQEHNHDGFSKGGWLPAEGLWFLEESIWPYARYRLQKLGFELVQAREPVSIS